MEPQEMEFQSTLPLREVTVIDVLHVIRFLFQSTLPLREVTKVVNAIESREGFQSTLPLREVTKISLISWLSISYFNPHFP